MFSELRVGVLAIVRSMQSGAISEEQADDLIRVLVSAYVGNLINQRVSNYLDYGLTQVLQRHIEGGNLVGERA